MTSPTIRFYRREKGDPKSVIAHFILDVHVEQFGGTLGIEGHLVMVNGKASPWIKAEICVPDSISAANAWILERFREWERGGR